MIKEYFSSLRTYLDDRLTSPILGSFSFAWAVANWKLVLFLLLSDKSIEDKIVHIESNYFEWQSLILYPALFAIFYTLVLPWPTWWVQYLQENVNKKRRAHKIDSETQYLIALQKKAEAQAEIDEIRLSSELSQEIKKKQRELELERDKAVHDFEIERKRKHLEFELEDRKREYEDKRQSRIDEIEHDKKMRELKFEERKRKEEMELERFKAEMQRTYK